MIKSKHGAYYVVIKYKDYKGVPGRSGTSLERIIGMP